MATQDYVTVTTHAASTSFNVASFDDVIPNATFRNTQVSDVNIMTVIVYLYFIPVLSVLGTVGNLLSLIILSAEKKKNTTTIILIALSIADLGYLDTNFTWQLSYVIQEFDTIKAQNYRNLIVGQLYPFSLSFTGISSLITVLISTERLTAVIFPLKVHSIFSRRRVLAILVSIFVGTFIMHGPQLGHTYTEWRINHVTNQSYVALLRTAFFTNNQEIFLYYGTFVLNVVFRFFPLFAVGFNTTIIIVRLKRASAWRGDITSSSNKSAIKREQKMTTMLVTICGLFFGCTAPLIVFQIYSFISEEFHYFGKERKIYLLFSPVNNLLQCLNACVNFVVYMALNPRFVKTFREVFSCCFFKSQG